MGTSSSAPQEDQVVIVAIMAQSLVVAMQTRFQERLLHHVRSSTLGLVGHAKSDTGRTTTRSSNNRNLHSFSCPAYRVNSAIQFGKITPSGCQGPTQLCFRPPSRGTHETTLDSTTCSKPCRPDSSTHKRSSCCGQKCEVFGETH
jgi:hypothetical protein